MSWTEFLERKSSLATALDIVGDKWSLMLLSGCLAGVCRFNEFEKFLGINRNLLSSRLDKLVSVGVLEKTKYQDHPPRYEYTATPIGIDLRPIVVGLASWGERHYTKEEAPFSIVHEDCDGKVRIVMQCESCNQHLEYKVVKTKINPQACARSTELYMQMHPEARIEK